MNDHGRGLLGRLAVITATALLAACGGGQVSSNVPAAGGQGNRQPFQHVIVLVQENRTVDNMFNGFPGADTVRQGNRYGKMVPLIQVPLQPQLTKVHDLGHGHNGFVDDYDGGKMDGFDHEFTNPDWGTAYAYVDPADVHNYWELASRFTLADEVFQANIGPSFPAHIAVIAGQTGYPFAVDNNPSNAGDLTGCFGIEKVGRVDMRTPFPGENAKDGPACVEVQTVFDLLDAKGLSWKYYVADYGAGLQLWNGPDYVHHLAFGPDHHNVVSPEAKILSDIAHHALPAVSYVIPVGCMSDHPRHSRYFALGGPKWVAEITNTIGKSEYWANTLILVTWDDWGGWYDHVPPPIINADEVGFRTPLLIISAYPAKPGVPDHTLRNQASILTAIESIFGLGSLNQLDAKTDDLSNDFAFGAPKSYGAALPAATPPPRTLCHVKNVEP